MDMAQATNAPETITIAGEDHVVRILTNEEWGVITAYLKKYCPSPLTRAYQAVQEAKMQGIPLDAATREEVLEHAHREAIAWPPPLCTARWFLAFDAVEDRWDYLLHQVLTKTEPTFTHKDAEALNARMTEVDWREVLRVARYGANPSLDPKAGAVQGTANGQTTTSPTTGDLCSAGSRN